MTPKARFTCLIDSLHERTGLIKALNRCLDHQLASCHFLHGNTTVSHGEREWRAVLRHGSLYFSRLARDHDHLKQTGMNTLETNAIQTIHQRGFKLIGIHHHGHNR